MDIERDGFLEDVIIFTINKRHTGTYIFVCLRPWSSTTEIAPERHVVRSVEASPDGIPVVKAGGR